MKTKLIITNIFIMAAVFVSTTAFAGKGGGASSGYFNGGSQSGHFVGGGSIGYFNGDGQNGHFVGGGSSGYFNGNRYNHYFGRHRYKHHYGHYRYRHYYGHHRHYRYPYHFYGAFYWPPPPQPPVYIYRQYPETIIYRENLPTPNYESTKDTSCLQSREYTATMVIDGKTVEAYGTKCLQPDGSWRYGPAQPVPDS